MAKDIFEQHQIPVEEKTLADFFQIKGGTLLFKGVFQTENFITAKRGVQIRSEGLTSAGGTIAGATISGGSVSPGNTLTVSQGGTGAVTLTGILLGSGTNAVTTVAGVSGSFYVANSSGGSPTHLVTVTNGVITNIA